MKSKHESYPLDILPQKLCQTLKITDFINYLQKGKKENAHT